jgi:hypothetical protein
LPEQIPLQEGVAIVPLVAGVDTKTDSDVLEAPKLLVLENASFFHPGAVAKDDGYPTTATTVVSGSSTLDGAPTRLYDSPSRGIFADASGLVEDLGTGYFRKAPGATLTGSVDLTRVDSVLATLTSGACAVACVVVNTAGDRFELCATGEDTGAGAIRWSIRNLDTGATQASGSSTGFGRTLRCAVGGKSVYLLWETAVAGTYDALYWNSDATGTAPTSKPGLIAGVGVNRPIDMVADATRVVIAWSTGLATNVDRYNATLVLQGSTNHATADAQQLTVCLDASGNQLVTYVDTANDVRAFGVLAAGGLRSSVLIEAGTFSEVTAVCRGGTDAAVFYLNSGSIGEIKFSIVAFTGASASAPATRAFGANKFLAKPFMNGAATLLPTFISAGDERAYHIIAIPASGAAGSSVGVFMYSTAYSPIIPGGSCVSTLIEARGTVFVFGAMQSVNQTTTGDITPVRVGYRPFDVQSAWLTPQSAPLIGDAFLAASGGQDSYFETAPVINSAIQANGAGALVSGSTYTWQVVWEARNSDGRLVRSVPSLPLTATLTGANNQITITATTPFVRSGATSITAVLYRTQAGPLATLTETKRIDASRQASSSVALLDQSSDATIATNRQIYTTGGVLEAWPAPMSGMRVLHQSRLWTIDPLSRELRYTREIIDGEAPAWHPDLAIATAATGIDPRALISTSNGLLVLGRDSSEGAGAAALLVGVGPNDLGQGSGFALQRVDACDTGPLHFTQAASTPLGAVYEDPIKGFHLLSPGAAPAFIGAPVEELRGTPSRFGCALAVSALADRQEVRIALVSGTMLVWHYAGGQWSKRSGSASAAAVTSAASWGGQHVTLRAAEVTAASTIWKQAGPRAASLAHRDAGSTYPYNLIVETGWVRLAQIAGIQRVWKLVLAGRFLSACQVQVLMYVDGNTTPSTYTFGAADITTNSDSLRLEIKPKVRKMEQFRVRVIVTPDAAGDGRDVSLSAIRIHYGALRSGKNVRKSAVRG